MLESPPTAPDAPAMRLNLHAISGALWRYRLMLALIVLAALVFGLVVLARAQPLYRVEMKLAIAEDDTARAGMAQQGIMSLAFLAGGSGQSQDLSRYYERMTGLQVAQYLQERYNILQTIHRQHWDDQREQWVAPEASLFSPGQILRRIADLPSWTEPDIADIAQFVRGSVRMDHDPKTGVMTLAILHPDPVFARQFMMQLHEAVVVVARQHSLGRINQRIDYLKDRIGGESLLEYRRILYQMLGSEEHKRMMLADDVPFYIEMFAEPMASVQPVSPRPGLILAIAFIVGCLLGVIAVLVRATLTSAAGREAG